MPDLKELLGEELFNQVSGKLGDHKIAVVSDGNWIPKTKFDEANEARKKAEADIGERDKQLGVLQKAAEGNEALQKQIKELQDANKADADKFSADMKELRTNTALKLALASDTQDVDIVLSLLDKSKIELSEDGSVKAGLDDQVKALRESKAFLFKEPPKGPQFRGIVPRDGTDSANGPTPEQSQYLQRLETARKAGNNVEAIKIKREAAEKGVILI